MGLKLVWVVEQPNTPKPIGGFLFSVRASIIVFVSTKVYFEA